jgi:hypothetical protein
MPNIILCGYSIYKSVSGAGVSKAMNRNSKFVVTPKLATGTKTNAGMGVVELVLSYPILDNINFLRVPEKNILFHIKMVFRFSMHTMHNAEMP